jgi:hypothetical protein
MIAVSKGSKTNSAHSAQLRWSRYATANLRIRSCILALQSALVLPRARQMILFRIEQRVQYLRNCRPQHLIDLQHRSQRQGNCTWNLLRL